MIKICYPPGTYGTYLARCVYYYTNLSKVRPGEFEFDHYGSSHSFRSNSVVQLDHVENNINFDINVLISEYKRLGIDNTINEKKLYCTMLNYNNHFPQLIPYPVVLLYDPWP